MSGKRFVSKRSNPLTLSLSKGRPEPFDCAQDAPVEGRPPEARMAEMADALG